LLMRPTTLPRHDAQHDSCCVVCGTSVVKADAADDDYDGDVEYRSAAGGDKDEEDQEADDAAVDTQWRASDTGHGRGAAVKLSRHAAAAVSSQQSSSMKYHSIQCLINDEYSVSCRQDASGDVYLPFRFIRKYFEVSLAVLLFSRRLVVWVFVFWPSVGSPEDSHH